MAEEQPIGRMRGVVDAPIVLFVVAGLVFGVYGIIVATGWIFSRPVKGLHDALAVGQKYWWFIAFAVGLIVGVVLGLYGWWRKATADRRRRNYFRNKLGMSNGAQLLQIAGCSVVRKRGKTLRPSVIKPRLEEVGYLEGTVGGKEVWSTVEDSVYVLGPPRSGKGYYIVINRILDAPGAVVTTSTRPDNLVATMAARKTGDRPVVVFDPERIAAGVEGGLKWSPVRGCEDPRTAAIRANGLVSAGFPAEGENKIWQGISSSIMRCLLHAAALEGLGARELYRWGVAEAEARDAVDILLRHPHAVPGWGEELQAVLDQDERTRSSSWLGVRQSLSGLADPTVLAAVSPRVGEGFDPADLIRRRGTLYMLGTSAGAVTSAPLIAALIEDVVDVSKRMAAGSAGARLDPPLALILDEAANYPIPSLPSLMSEGGGSGISTLCVWQSYGQTRKAYGNDGADAIWDSATVKKILGGAGKRETLEDISALIGERDEATTSTTQNSRLSLMPSSFQESVRRVRILPADEVRQIPAGMALVILKAAPLTFLDMRSWDMRKDAKDLKAASRAATQEITTSAAQSL